MPAKIEFKNPAATATMIVQKEYEILLIKRKHPPYEGMWALPGGFLNCDKESLEEAAIRELNEETGLIAKIEDIDLLCVNSSPKRDPRGHVIDHVYIVQRYTGTPKANDDAAEYKWFSLDSLPPIAFDHLDAIKYYMSQGYAHLNHKM